METAQGAGVTLTSICGGEGTCSKCKVIVKEGGDALTPVTGIERNCFSEAEIGDGYRLACEARIGGLAEVTVEIPLESRSASYRLQAEGSETPVALDPSVTAVHFEAVPPGPGVATAVDESVRDALKKAGISIDLVDSRCLEAIAPDLRGLGWRGEAIVYDRSRLMALVKDGTPLLGMAFDLGTTKLAAYLLDLRTGKVLATTSQVNPNVLYGDDVMSRLSYIADHPEGFERLSASLRGAVSQMIGDACRQCGEERSHVREMVFVGNTLMHHLAMGLEPSSLGSSPYAPITRETCRVEARSLGLVAGAGCMVYSLPNVAGFVGADCVADALAAGFDRKEGTALMVDIGTNTELILLKDGHLWTASTASGPAFEGAHIKHGMRAASGAVEHVALDESLRVRYQTIDGAPASGICGSGTIDIVAELVHHGMMDESGRMRTSQVNSLIVEGADCLEAVIVPPGESASRRSITFTQKDTRELQKAKAAVAAGIAILMERASTVLEEISELVVAGAFGTYVDMQNAMAIGMLPHLPLNRVRQVGNSAGTGARMCLLSREAKVRADLIARKMEYVELAGSAVFQAAYLRSLGFPPHRGPSP